MTGTPSPTPPTCLVEIGAQSLKVHRYQLGLIQTEKHGYDLGHEVYQTGRISLHMVNSIVEQLRTWGTMPALAIATSAVRDAENPELLTRGLQEALGIEVLVFSPLEEVELLVRSYLAHGMDLPAMILDIGGGSVETVFLTPSRRFVWDSLPLGVIRLHHQWKAGGSSAMAGWIESHLRKASIILAETITGSGGTVKAIAKTLARTTFGREDLARLEAGVRRAGPPPWLKPDRAKVFLPGVVLVRSLVEFMGAEIFNYVDISVGRRALEERLGAVFFTKGRIQHTLAAGLEPIHADRSRGCPFCAGLRIANAQEVHPAMADRTVQTVPLADGFLSDGGDIRRPRGVVHF